MPNTRKSNPPELATDDLSSTVIKELNSPHRAVSVKISPKKAAFKQFEEANFRWAKWLHEAAFIYAIYGALDGLSLSYSTIKYAFDVSQANQTLTSADDMHDWMTTPGGIIISATETVAILALSMIANIVKADDGAAFNRYVVLLWPYFRDTMKGLKNAYKGIRSSLQAFGTLAGQNLQHLVVPFGLCLGVLSVANRIWYRQMKSARKEQQTANTNAVVAIHSLKFINDDVVAVFRKGIQRQSDALCVKGLLSAAYGGVVDGLYLYMGVMGVAILAPQVFVAILVCSLIFSAICIATRMYEEYDYQRRLKATEAGVELALCVKEMELMFYELQLLIGLELALEPKGIIKKAYFSKDLLSDRQKLVELSDKKKTLLIKIDAGAIELDKRRKDVHAQVTLSYQAAALAGLKNGLAAYTSISGLMFAVAVINLLVVASFPPALLIACVIAGLVCLVGFLAHALIINHYHLQKIKPKEGESNIEFGKLLKLLKSKESAINYLDPTKVEEAAAETLAVETSPPMFVEEWFEVLRSFFSGFGKGQKSVDFVLAPIQGPDDQQQHQDSPMMLWFTGLSSLVYAFGLGLRAYARGLGENAYHKLSKPKSVLLKVEQDLNRPQSSSEVRLEKNKMPLPVVSNSLCSAKKLLKSSHSDVKKAHPLVQQEHPTVALPKKVAPKIIAFPKPLSTGPLSGVVRVSSTRKPKVALKLVSAVEAPSEITLEEPRVKPIIESEREWVKPLFPSVDLKAKLSVVPEDVTEDEIDALEALPLAPDLHGAFVPTNVEGEPSDKKKAALKSSPINAFLKAPQPPGGPKSRIIIPVPSPVLQAPASLPGEPDLSSSPKTKSSRPMFLSLETNLMRTGMSGGLLDETIAPLTGRPTPASTLGKPGSSGLLARNPKAQSAVSLGKAVPLKKLGSTGDVLKIQGKGSAFGLVQPGRGPEFFQKRKIVSLADFSSVRTTSRPVTSVEDAHTSPDSTPGRCTFYIGNVS